jgi:hypothetical protein
MIFDLDHQNRFSDQDVLVDVDGNRKQRCTENRPILILMKSSTVKAIIKMPLLLASYFSNCCARNAMEAFWNSRC